MANGRALAELDSDLDGTVFTPESPGYDPARFVWDSRFDVARPAAVVRVASAADVSSAIEFARAEDLPLVVRGGAHSYGGYSTGDGLVIDLSDMTALEVGAGSELARLGAGSTTLDVYRGLWLHRKAIVGGTCPTVGITGLATGGGLGVLSRVNGLTCDNLVEAEIVTADGRIRRVSEGENAGLFWAIRGGGGGTFGVITELRLRLVPVDMPFTHAHFEFPWSAAVNVLAAWQEWLPTSPRATWTCVELETRAPGDGVEPIVVVELVHAGPEEEAAALVEELIGAIGAPTTERASATGPFFDTERDFFCKGLRRKEWGLAGKTPDGRFPRQALYAKSDIATGPWPAAGLEALVAAIESRQRDPVLTPVDFDPMQTVGKVLIEAADGEINAVAPGATAFVHRDNLFVAQFQCRWRADAGREVEDANRAWVSALHAEVEPYRSGSAYQNYIDPDLDGWERAYYGANLERLRAVKSRYDPEDRFSFAQSIRPA